MIGLGIIVRPNPRIDANVTGCQGGLMDENVAELVQPSLIKKWRHCPASAVQKKICSFNGRSSP